MFYLYIFYRLYMMIYFKKFESVIYFRFCHIFFKAVKELHKVPFTISIYTSIGSYTITDTYT